MRLLLLSISLFLAPALQAQMNPGYPPPPAPPAPQFPVNNDFAHPQEMVKQGVARLEAFVEGNNLEDAGSVSAFLAREVSPFFDFERMTGEILGPLNYHLDDQQRASVRDRIQQQFLTALASNLANYKGGKVEYVNINGNLSQGRVNVALRVYRPGQFSTIVLLRIGRTGNDWKIYDVSANGVSAVAHYRNYILSTVQRSGIQALFQ